MLELIFSGAYIRNYTVVRKPVVWYRFSTEMGGAQVVGTISTASGKKMGGAASNSNFGEELDKSLILASQQFERQQLSTMEITFPHTHFAAPKSEVEILQMRQNAVTH